MVKYVIKMILPSFIVNRDLQLTSHMFVEKTIPIFRIFDYQKTIEFYVDWLGFEIAWEHRFDENAPVYIEIVKDGLTLHLSEHHGDGTPGSRVFVWCKDLKAYHQQLIDKKYKYNRPGYEETFYDSWSITVDDPFGNKILFNEKKAEKRTNRTSE